MDVWWALGDALSCGLLVRARRGIAAQTVMSALLMSKNSSMVVCPGRINAMLEALNTRFWHIIVSLFAAIVSAALLRHTVHVYAGISREEIRAGALIACFIVVFFLVLFMLKRRS